MRSYRERLRQGQVRKIERHSNVAHAASCQVYLDEHSERIKARIAFAHSENVSPI